MPLLVAPFLSLALAGPAPPRPAPDNDSEFHELHETYAAIAIEDDVVGARFRFFKTQLETALGELLDADAIALRPGAEGNALVFRYLRDHLTIEADGTVLKPALVDGGAEPLGHHDGWWVVLQWEAPASVGEVRIENTLQFEIFDDQRNVMRVVRLPGGSPMSYYTTADEAQIRVSADPTAETGPLKAAEPNP